MTTPTPVVAGTPVEVKNTKAWIATIGGLIISQGPMILQLLGHLPAPWGLVFTGIGSVLAAFTGAGTWKASNVPTGTIPILPHPAQPSGSGWPAP